MGEEWDKHSLADYMKDLIEDMESNVVEVEMVHSSDYIYLEVSCKRDK